jgi:hypothetical protein
MPVVIRYNARNATPKRRKVISGAMKKGGMTSTIMLGMLYHILKRGQKKLLPRVRKNIQFSASPFRRRRA